MEEAPKDKVPNMEDHVVLKYFEDVFKEIPGLPPKRDIDFSINLMPRSSSSIKESLQNEYTRDEGVANASRRAYEDGLYTPKRVTLGCPSLIHEEKIWDIEIVH
jgi:hypothetical protein